MNNNPDFETAEFLLLTAGYTNIKRWVEYKPAYTIVALEVYCSPLLMKDNIDRIQGLLSASFNVNGNTNQSYILIRKS